MSAVCGGSPRRSADSGAAAHLARRTPRRRLVRTGLLMLAAICSAAVAVALAPAMASAHAYAVSSDPPAGAVLKSAPTVVTVHFAENVNPQGSDILVYDATHKQVSTAPAQVSRADTKTMTVPMSGDGDGTYLVEWHTVSADDGDPDIGAYNFIVNSRATTTTSSGSSGTTGGSSGVPVYLAIVIGLVGLALGGGAGYYLTRRAGGGSR